MAGKRSFRVGQHVRVKVRGLPHAKIERFLGDVDGGVRLLFMERRGFAASAAGAPAAEEGAQQMTEAEKIAKRGGCLIADPLPLMVRYLDGKPDLTNDEREILLFALYMESKANNGLAAKGLTRLAGEGKGAK